MTPRLIILFPYIVCTTTGILISVRPDPINHGPGVRLQQHQLVRTRIKYRIPKLHDSAGRYIATLGIGEREYRLCQQDDYFVVETNIGLWQTLLKTDSIFYTPISINGVPYEPQAEPVNGSLTVAADNGFLTWELDEFLAQTRAFRPTVNIHAENDTYITTDLATDGRWPAPRTGGYCFVAVVGEYRDVFDWRTWSKSDVVQVGVNEASDEFTPANYQDRLGESLSRWRAEYHAPFRNAITTAPGQWFPALPDLHCDNGLDRQGNPAGVYEVEYESGFVTGYMLDIEQNENGSRLQMELDFTECVFNALTHDG